MTMIRNITPWNPSKNAIARVKHPVKAPKVCPCCRGLVTLEPNEVVYGKSYGDWPWVFVCFECDAYVGLHPYTDIPLGTLADKPTREARKLAKIAFTVWYESARIERSSAYRILAEEMQLERKLCHFAMFTQEQCELAIERIGEQHGNR